jgi:hypothetical protein
VVSWTPANDGQDARDRNEWNRDEWNREDDRGHDRDRGRDRDRDRDRDRRDGFERDRGELSWHGDVDDVADIRIQGRRVEYVSRSGQPLRNVSFDIRGGGLPRRSVNVELDVARGRGNVVVVQQPTERNGFTAVIRVIDRRSGYGDYDFDLRWY